MKIHAVRLANVGRFGTPIAIEGFGGTLDLLIGPNEAGKSTIFRALETLFLQKYTMGGRNLERLRPYGGGEPLIEADFDAAGGCWRVTKQFGRGKLAELADRAAGRTIARGEEAEERLKALIGGGGGAAMLWAGQQSLLTHKPPEGDAREALVAAIERNVEAVVAGPEARLVREKVSAALERLIQPRRKAPVAGGAYHTAIARRDALRARLATAQAEADAAAGRLDELETLRRRLEETASPTLCDALVRAAAQARAAAEGGVMARQRLEAALAAARAASLEHEKAATALEAFDRVVGESEALAARLRGDETRSETLAAELARSEPLLKAEEEALARLTHEERAANDLIAAIAAAESRASASHRLEDRSRALHAARKLETIMAEASQALSLNGATAERLDRAVKLERDLAMTESTIAAAAPSVQVRYAAGGEGRITADGTPVRADMPIVVREPLALDIAGVGTITVRPGETTGAALGLTAERQRRDLTQALSEMGVVSLEDARARHAARLRAEQALVEARANLKGIATGGVSQLALEVESLAAELAEAGAATTAPSDLPPRKEAEARLKASRRSQDEVGARVAELRRKHARLVADAQSLDARIAAEQMRLAEINAALPLPAARGEERSRRATAAEHAGQAARAAAVTVEGLKVAAPSEARLAELKDVRDRTARAAADAAAAARRLEDQIIAVTSKIERDDEDGAALVVADLARQLERAEGVVGRFAREVESLELLGEVLDALEGETRDRFLKPVAERLSPYLGLVFSGGRLSFGEGHAIESFERAALSEQFDALSLGTREQIAVLVRLAYARLMSDSGQAMPVVLDDALVFSDDDRIAAMFSALEAAARHHQVIVLTCRRRSFEALAAKRLEIVPWARR